MKQREAPVPAPQARQPAAAHRAPAQRAQTQARPGRTPAAQLAVRLAALQRPSPQEPALQRRAEGAPSIVGPAMPEASAAPGPKAGGGAAPRAAAPPAPPEPPPRRNRTGLPDRLKAGMETLSGFGLDDVRVHYGSPKPAELQALAYTQGTEIHVGPGQERHLAHEAWHVVQQKQGRVRATRQMKGVAVNDESWLEREADTMAVRALAIPAAPAPVELPSLGAVGAGPVAQLLAAQIISQDGVVTALNIVGRPEAKLFGTSMGAHTTAWAVLVDSVKGAVIGKTHAEARLALRKMILDSQHLPGFGAMKGAESDWFGRFKRAFAAVMEALDAGKGQKDPGELNLQQLIRLYLEYRELLPYSAVNLKAAQMKVAGLGESAHLRLLRAVQGGTELADRDSVRGAIAGVLDLKALARVAIEPDSSMVAVLAPAADSSLDAEGRLKAMLQQHYLTILAAYPKALAVAEITAADQMLGALPGLPKAMAEVLSWELTHLRQRVEWTTASRDMLQHKLGNSILLKSETREHQGKIDAFKLDLEALNKRITSLDDLAKKYALPLDIVPVKKTGSVVLKPSESSKSLENIGKTDNVEKNENVENIETAETAENEEEEEEEAAAEEERAQPLAVEIEIFNGQISGLRTGGRPPSPHSGTMGAHTTAWVVRTDALRSALVGKKTSEVPDVLARLKKEMDAVNKDLGSIYVMDERQKWMFEWAEAQFNESLKAFRLKPTVSGVQIVIAALLTFINVSPGVSRDKTKTTGRGEGRRRAELLFPIGKPAAIRAAIRKMLDVKPGASGYELLAMAHLALVERAYPAAYKRTGWRPVSKLSQLDPADALAEIKFDSLPGGKKSKRKKSYEDSSDEEEDEEDEEMLY